MRPGCLCLEDDAEDFDFIIDTLQKGGFNLVSLQVIQRQEFVKALDVFKPDVILSDHALPLFDSTEALVISKINNPRIPFILVTGAVSDEFAVKALKLGADDYVLKSNLPKLPSVVKNVLRQKEADLAKRKAALELTRRNEELSKINKELDSFVYSVSHNLRAPLMSVLGLVRLAKDEKDIQYLGRYHDMMENSILKLDETLKEILEYSRNARQEMKVSLVNFKEILEDNFQKMQFMPDFAGIEKKIVIDATTPFFSDAYRLSVIFNNLISNSIKYSDRSKAKQFIHIKVQCNEQHATFEFTDNGFVIDKKLQSKVFDMFFRATESKDGAGLGLYIVREAVDMLKGTINIQSTFGEGTIFKMVIPNMTKQKSFQSQNSILVDRG